MRQIGTLAEGDQAQRFVDYLLVRGIEARADHEPDGWALWIFDEDSVAKAKDELSQFLANPEESRFREAAAHAAELRRDSAKKHEEIRKRVVNVQERWRRPLLSQIPVTFLLATACVGATLSSDFGEWSQPTTQRMQFSAPKRPGGEGLLEFLHEPVFARIREGQVWRLVTPIFLHGNNLHLIGNMYWLIVLGGMVEFRRGSLRYLGLTLLFAVVSNVSQALYQGPLFLGMSGVVYGLFGYVWMRSRYMPESGLFISPANVLMMMAWFVVCLTPAAGPVANAAHWGGLVSGVLVGYAPRLWNRFR